METAYKCCLISKPRRFHSRNTPPPPDDPPPPEDVISLFSLHAGGAPHMDEDGLRRCLSAYQGGGEGEGLDNDVEHLLEKIRGTGGGPRIPRQQLFTLDDFHRILFSHDVNPPIQHHRRVHHDMTLPLSHYFIYSGHNPYYATPPADQRRGGRSDEPIIRALKMGVRAIEVAMWPNSKEDDIKIHHGWTQNTPVLLTECLKSIKEYAFVASRYPVIITLEDNLPTSKLQKKAAKVVLDVFGDLLYWPDVRGNADTNNPLKEFPSPEELKGRVLLSIKPPTSPTIIKKGKAKPMEVDESKVDGTTEQGDATAWGAEVPDFQTETQPAKKHDGDASGSGHQRRLHDENDDEDQKEQTMQPNEYPLYRHLITIRPEKQKATERRVSTLETEPGLREPSLIANQTKEIEKVSLVDALHSEPGKVRRLSWSKQQTEKAAKDRGTDIVRFTQRNLLRIYPSFSTDRYYPRPTRLTSYNYNPFLGWVHGAQMVALNLQEYGRALWLMHGFYRANGGCGYVRKPNFLMKYPYFHEYGRDLSLIHGFRRAGKPGLVMQTEPAEVFDPRERQPVKKTLKVKVYMGDGWLMDLKHAHMFIPDMWTSVGIAGVPADTTAMKNTKASENTWVPVWEDEFSFPLTVPEIALLRVEVHQYDLSEKDIFGGQTVLPVWELRQGIRAVALFDRQGNRLDNVKLLMRFVFV
ncbi:phosphoinositide phospholipase C 2-like [Miscanthus floridulus]|uniref:phosphoinositide phospholipase C 2-like n=1 Tax=Miscanthus floridulus TaxID=154761 RepID=UPI00345B40A0